MPPPSTSHEPTPACFQAVAAESSSKRHQSATSPESRCVTGPVAAARSSQWVSPSGAAYGVSARLSPCRVASPVRSVSGTIHVVESEKPTTQVGSAAAIAS